MRAPVRIDRLRLGLFAALGAAAAPSLLQWGRGEPQQEQLPQGYISLQLIAGPSPLGWTRARGRPVVELTEATFTVGAVAEDDVAALQLNNVFFKYDIPAAATPTTVRDALLAMIAAEPGIAAAASGVDAIVVTPLQPGDLWDARAGGVVSVATETDGVLELTAGLYQARIQLDAFHKDPYTGAHELATQAQHALLTKEVSEALWLYGIALAERNAPIRDLSAIADGYWESRAAFDFSVCMVGATARKIESVDSVVISAAVQAAGVLVQLSPFSVQLTP